MTTGESSLWEDGFNPGAVSQCKRAKLILHCPRPLFLFFIVITLVPTLLQCFCIRSSQCTGTASASTATASAGSLPPSLSHTTFSPASGNVLPTFPVLPSPLLSHSSTIECGFSSFSRSRFWCLQIDCSHTHLWFVWLSQRLMCDHATTLSFWSRDDGRYVASCVFPSS